MRLTSCVEGEWRDGQGEGRPLVNPVTGEKLAEADSSGLDMKGALRFARDKGGAVIGEMSFAERGALLKNVADTLVANRDKYEAIARTNSGNTKTDAAVDIDGGIGTLKYYARLGQSLGGARMIGEFGEDQLAKEPVFFSRHYWTSRPGVAVQINAFNFPSWGMWEKIAVATIAGSPSIAKPATATALLSHEMMKDVLAAGVVPSGVLTIVCGAGEGLLEAVGPMDSIAFTGSAGTGLHVRSHPGVLSSGARVTIEADSVNGTILGPDVAPGTPLFDLAVREITKALSLKAGQLCTNIRRIFVPRQHAQAFADAVLEAVRALKVGDPSDESVRVGPLINRRQQRDALDSIARLASDAKLLTGSDLPDNLDAACRENGAFVAPTLLFCEQPGEVRSVHEIEVFGPCATIMPYDDLGEAIVLAIRGGGSLALSCFTEDGDVQLAVTSQLGPWHGRIMFVDATTGRNHTGHGIVMPQCVHGGPGRAGNGEELGGLRGLRFHMQRSAIQGSRAVHETLAARVAQAGL